MGLRQDILIGDYGFMGQGITYQGSAGNPAKKVATVTTHVPYKTQGPSGATLLAASKKEKLKQLAHAAATPSGGGTKLMGRAGEVWTALQQAGFPESVIKFVFIMLYMESGAFTNGPTVNDFNPGNIMWYKGVPKGTWIAANGTYAAHYTSWSEFAAALKRLLSKGPGYPIQATTLADFAHRLKMNNYYGQQSEASYLAALQGAQQRLRIIGRLQDDANQTITHNAADADKKIGPLGWLGLGIVGIFAARAIFQAAGN